MRLRLLTKTISSDMSSYGAYVEPDPENHPFMYNLILAQTRHVKLSASSNTLQMLAPF